jgi:hypothetical protein
MKPGSVTRDQEAGSKNGNFKNGDWTAEAIEGVEVAGNNSATRGIAAISRISNSLEGLGAPRRNKSSSDKAALFAGFDYKRVIAAVRTAARPIVSKIRERCAPPSAE